MKEKTLLLILQKLRLYGNTMNNMCVHVQMYTHIYAVNPCHVKNI